MARKEIQREIPMESIWCQFDRNPIGRGTDEYLTFILTFRSSFTYAADTLYICLAYVTSIRPISYNVIS